MNVQNMDRKEYLKSLALLGIPLVLSSCTIKDVGDGDVASSISIEIEFTEAMEQDSFIGLLSITNGELTASPEKSVWKGDHLLSLTFRGIESTDGWSFTLSDGATDKAGNPLYRYSQSL